MSTNKEYDEIQVDEYKGAQLQVYNDTYGLLSLDYKGGENTTYYKQWVFLSKWVNGKGVPSDKALPMAVRLGDKETAIRVLKEVLAQLEGGVT